MFNKEKNTTTEKSTSNSATLISAGTVVQGDLKSESDLRIDGTIKGNVTSSAKIIVGPTGFVEGNIQGSQADISGKVIGNINVTELTQLRTKSSVQGNISAVSLQIESGAAFNGQSIMAAGKNVVHMNEGEVLHAKAK
jgi:cytoskeletal protein CcmA (bactofilin family)